MGYYSVQMFSTTHAGYNRFMDLLKAASVGVKYPIKKFEHFEDRDNGVVFGFNWIKWYGSDVDAFEQAWEAFDKEGYPWTRVRIGEEFGDVDETSSKIAWDVNIPHLFTVTSWDSD